MLLVASGGTALGVLARCASPLRVEPVPPPARSDVLPAETPPSVISMPLVLPVEVLLRLLEDAVPVAHGTEASPMSLPDQGRTSARMTLQRGPLSASFVGDEARVRTTIRYGLRVSYDLPGLPDVVGSCGQGSQRRPGLAVTLTSPVSLDQDWGLRTRAQVVDVRPASRTDVDRCEVTVLGLDVTDRVVQGARGYLEENLRAIDGRAARVDTRSRFERWWRVLQDPIELDDSLWLSIGPEAIRRGSVTGTGDSVRIQLGLSARPRIVLGRRPMASVGPLPPLDTGAIEPRLDLLVDARADYGSIGRLITQRMGGRALEMRGIHLRVDSIDARGIGGGKMALEVHVSGDLEGRLYFVGTPVLDIERGRVTVPDLELDLATERVLTDLLPSLIALTLRDVIRHEANWPLDPAVRWLEDWLRRGLNRDLTPDLQVAGVVDSVEVVGVYPLRTALLVRLTARGSATLVIRG